MIKKTKKGFTIVELVIVIGVIGILSAILIPTFIGVTANANKARTKSDLANAYAMYAADAADGYFGDEEDGLKLEFLGQEKVALAKETSATEFYLFDSEKGWATDLDDVTNPTALKYEATAPAESAQVKYGGYYFWKINANA